MNEFNSDELLDALYWMYIQYCGETGHLFMGAGEEAARLLVLAEYIQVDPAGRITRDLTDQLEEEE